MTRFNHAVVTLAALVASGCLEGDPNPYDVTEESDGGDASLVDTADLPVSADVARGDGRSTIAEGAECSVNSGIAVQVRFENGYPSEDLTLFWVDSSCNEIEYATIVAGTSYVQSTFQGHPWRLRSSRGLLHEYMPDDEPFQMVPLP